VLGAFRFEQVIDSASVEIGAVIEQAWRERDRWMIQNSFHFRALPGDELLGKNSARARQNSSVRRTPFPATCANRPTLSSAIERHDSFSSRTKARCVGVSVSTRER
jgi:hypothetical protein